MTHLGNGPSGAMGAHQSRGTCSATLNQIGTFTCSILSATTGIVRNNRLGRYVFKHLLGFLRRFTVQLQNRNARIRRKVAPDLYERPSSHCSHSGKGANNERSAACRLGVLYQTAGRQHEDSTTPFPPLAFLHSTSTCA
jgi:hypothetical protein